MPGWDFKLLGIFKTCLLGLPTAFEIRPHKNSNTCQLASRQRIWQQLKSCYLISRMKTENAPLIQQFKFNISVHCTHCTSLCESCITCLAPETPPLSHQAKYLCMHYTDWHCSTYDDDITLRNMTPPSSVCVDKSKLSHYARWNMHITHTQAAALFAEDEPHIILWWLLSQLISNGVSPWERRF